MTEEEKGLTDFEEACCREYIANGGNQSAAFRAHNAKSMKWTDASVWNRASQLFARPHVKAYLNELREKVQQVAAEKFDITVERVLQELARVAFGDIRKMFSADGKLLLPVDLDDDTAATIASMDVVTFTHGEEGGDSVEFTHRYKKCDKLKAIEMLARHLQMFTPKTEDTEQEDARFRGQKVPGWMEDMIPSAEK